MIEAHRRFDVASVPLYRIVCGPRLMLIDTMLALEVF